MGNLRFGGSKLTPSIKDLYISWLPPCRGEVSMLQVWKNALELFVWNKHLINNEHEFAIVIMREKAEWVRGVCVCVCVCVYGGVCVCVEVEVRGR